MIDNPVQLNSLFELMDQEVASYKALLDDIRQEWECLKKDDTSSLVSLVQTKETHISTIKMIRESMNQILIDLMGDPSGKDHRKTLLDLAHRVVPPQTKRIKNYQKGVDQLKQQIIHLNEQNKRFIQETLDYLRDIFSLFTSCGQECPTYAQGGRTVSTSLPPCCMSRKV